MELLPDELHTAIASYLSPHDYPNYRLISKRFSYVGADFLFSDFLFSPSTHTLQRMDLILQSELKTCIKTLDYDGRVYYIPSKRHNDPPSNPGPEVLVKVVEAFAQAGVRITNLTAHALPYDFFDPGRFPDSFHVACANLTALNIQTQYDETVPGRTLCAFLKGLEKLESLTLHFGPQRYYGFNGPRPYLYDVLPRGKMWARLRRVALKYVRVTIGDLLLFLGVYSETLREVHLAGITMVRVAGESELGNIEWRKNAWRCIFEGLATMTRLQEASVRESTVTAVRVWRVYGPERWVDVSTDVYGCLADEEDE